MFSKHFYRKHNKPKWEEDVLLPNVCIRAISHISGPKQNVGSAISETGCILLFFYIEILDLIIHRKNIFNPLI
jgi:hypothetical protein